MLEKKAREERRAKLLRKRGNNLNLEIYNDVVFLNPSPIASTFPRVWYLARILIIILEIGGGCISPGR